MFLRLLIVLNRTWKQVKMGEEQVNCVYLQELKKFIKPTMNRIILKTNFLI